VVRFALAFGLAVLGVVAAGAARAEPPSPACGGEPACTPKDAGPAARVALYAEHGFDAELRGERGALAVERLGLIGATAVPVSARTRLRLQYSAERAWYDLSDPDDVVAGEGRLLADAAWYRFEPKADIDLSRSLTLTVGPILGSSGALGARFEDTLTYGALGAVRFPIGGGRTLRVGAAYETVLEDRASIFPVFEIGGLGKGSGGLSIEGRGTGVRAGVPLSERLTLGGAVRYDRRDWRLAEADRVPGGVFRDIRLALGADLEWKPRDNVVLAVAAWVTVYHALAVDDRRGERVTDFEADTSLMVSVGFSVEF
jgi:hypothetical protein